ncbi:MAG TPA: trehalase-like domain-containing protein [Egibacteraceae bacterium]|nr:trehalase-like domain-containing protein [Egibacteraceae bacterium]
MPLPLRRVDGYLPIEDHGLVGDGTTAALVGRDGAVSWLCVPRFDGRPLFCGILDRTRGGTFVAAPHDLVASRQRHVEDTGVLVTELHTPDGVVEVTDALPLRPAADLAEQSDAGRGELLRRVRVVQGRVGLRVAVTPRGGAGATRESGGLLLRCPAEPRPRLYLHADRRLDGPDAVYDLGSGDELQLTLSWSGRTPRGTGRTP